MQIKLNKFKKQDINFLFKLRNKREVRKYSLNRKIISKKEHKKWFDQKLKDKKSKIFIIIIKKHKVGYIRLDKKEYWLVSISILKNFRNKTIGKKALSILQNQSFPKSTYLCEPFLTKRNLYPTLSTKKKLSREIKKVTNFIQYADGKNSLEKISEKIKVNLRETKKINSLLIKKKLVF